MMFLFALCSLCGATPEPNRQKAQCTESKKEPSSETYLQRTLVTGCEVLPHDSDSWQKVYKIELTSIKLAEDTMEVNVVFLSKDNKRVLPYGKFLRFDVQFENQVKKTLEITKERQKDGIFYFKLPPNRRAKPCKTFLKVEYRGKNGTIKFTQDDWLYSC